MKLQFYRCNICGQIVAVVEETGVPIVCCGEEMELIVPGTTDGAYEKHVPVVTCSGNMVTVNVGEKDHPMDASHYIEWIAIQCRNGNQRKQLSPGMKPEVCFALCDDDRVEKVYAYCNIHSLWSAEVNCCE